MKSMMEIKERKSVTFEPKNYAIISDKESDFIEVTEWASGEGWDINIEIGNTSKSFSLHYDELDIINYLVKYLEYNDKN